MVQPGTGILDGVLVRAASDTDLAGIGQISHVLGHPQLDYGADPDYVALLRRSGDVAVAVEDGRVLGWGAVRDHVAGSMLTDLFVHPSAQGRGVGSAVLRALWPDPAPDAARLTFSSQHPSALPLYLRAGLLPSWPLLYLRGRPGAVAVPDGVGAVRVDGAAAARAEAGLTGTDRAADYAFWTRTPGAAGLLVRRGDRPIACGAARPDAVLHLTCPRAADAVAALAAVLVAVGEQAGAGEVTVCVPGPHRGTAELVRSGFRVVDQDICMSTASAAVATTWCYAPGLG